MTTTLRVHFDGTVLIPEQPVDFPVGLSLEVHVTRLDPSRETSGSPSAVIRAAHADPHVSSEDVAELESIIQLARLPLRDINPFDGSDSQ